MKWDETMSRSKHRLRITLNGLNPDAVIGATRDGDEVGIRRSVVALTV